MIFLNIAVGKFLRRVDLLRCEHLIEMDHDKALAQMKADIFRPVKIIERA